MCKLLLCEQGGGEMGPFNPVAPAAFSGDKSGGSQRWQSFGRALRGARGPAWLPLPRLSPARVPALSWCLRQCHVSSVPVFNSMKQPEVKTWGAVVTAAMVIALFVYTGTGK